MEGDRGQGAGARENRGRERAGSGIYMRAGSGSRNKEGDSLLFITGYYFFLSGHSNESCNLIGSLPGQYFPISAHGPR